MQSNYRTPKKTNEKNEVPDTVSTQPKKIKRRTSKTGPADDKYVGDEEDLIEALEDNEYEESTDGASKDEVNSIRPRTERKRFGDMTIEEKVNYFVGLPSQVPRMKCEVRTEDERHQGVIADYKDGMVHMVTKKRPRMKTIPIEAITNIRLLSF